MKLKSKKSVGIFLAVFFIAGMSAWLINWHMKKEPAINNDCSAFLAMHQKTYDFSAKLSVYLNMHSNNTGYLDMSGTINRHGVEYTTARAWSFSYQLQNGSILHLTDITTHKRAADNTLDDVIDKLIFSTTSGSSRYVKITALNNAWVISNLYSPMFICVINTP